MLSKTCSFMWLAGQLTVVSKKSLFYGENIQMFSWLPWMQSLYPCRCSDSFIDIVLTRRKLTGFVKYSCEFNYAKMLVRRRVLSNRFRITQEQFQYHGAEIFLLGTGKFILYYSIFMWLICCFLL